MLADIWLTVMIITKKLVMVIIIAYTYLVLTM